jgi:hypothetical protein
MAVLDTSTGKQTLRIMTITRTGSVRILLNDV